MCSIHDNNQLGLSTLYIQREIRHPTVQGILSPDRGGGSLVEASAGAYIHHSRHDESSVFPGDNPVADDYDATHAPRG